MIEDKRRLQEIINSLAALCIAPESSEIRKTVELLLSNQQRINNIEEDLNSSLLTATYTDNNDFKKFIEKDKLSSTDSLKELKEFEKNAICEELEFFMKLNEYTRSSRVAFLDQCAVRNQLAKSLMRFPNADEYEYEELFSKFCDKMNDDEKRKFKFIRQITERIAEYNSKTVTLLKENRHKKVYTETSDLQLLLDHLQFWLDKYNAYKNDVCSFNLCRC